MSELDDTTLETMLREGLSARLNDQLGRSAAAFMAHVGREDAGAPAHEPAPPLRMADAPGWRAPTRVNSWVIGLAGAALAASLAALWVAPAAFRARVPFAPIHNWDATMVSNGNPGDPAMVADSDLSRAPGQPPLIQWVQNRTVDEGTVILDEPGRLVPARKLRHLQLEHTQWYDPAQRGQVEMTVPRENIKFVTMDTY